MAKLALLFGYGQSADGELLPQSKSRCAVASGAYYRGEIEKIYITCYVKQNGILMSNKMRDYLRLRGVKFKDIIIIAKGTNTAGEIDIFLDYIRKEAGDEIIAISTAYHLPRIRFLFWTRGIRVKTLGNWQDASWPDIRIEPLKMFNSLIRPFSSSKKLA